MRLKCHSRIKDGKEHRYFSIVENKRVADGRVMQRHVLYLGEINSSQELAWRKSIEVFEDGQERASTLALFPADRCEAVIADESVVRVRLSELALCRPRQWVAQSVRQLSRNQPPPPLLTSRPARQRSLSQAQGRIYGIWI